MKLFRILAAAIAVAAVSCADKDLEVTVPIGNPYLPLWEHVTKVAEVQVPAGASTDVTRYSVPFEAPAWALKGKHALFLVAEGPEGVELCDIVGLGFSRKGECLEFPQPPAVRFLAAGEPLEMPSHPILANDLNGFSDCTNYEIHLPEGVSISDVTVEADPSVTIESDSSAFRLTWNGKTKTYFIR